MPRVLFFEVPVVAGIPLGILIQIAVPTWAASVTLVATTLVLARRRNSVSTPAADLWAELRTRLGVASRCGLLAAAIACVLVLIPLIGLLLIFVLTPLVIGPPLVAQAVAVEGSSLRAALSRSRAVMVGRSGRVTLYLLCAGLAAGLISTLLVGGAMYLALDAGAAIRVVIGSVYQSVSLGAIVGFLATVEFVLYEELSRTAVSNPD